VLSGHAFDAVQQITVQAGGVGNNSHDASGNPHNLLL
jgi:hypothetical protein